MPSSSWIRRRVRATGRPIITGAKSGTVDGHWREVLNRDRTFSTNSFCRLFLDSRFSYTVDGRRRHRLIIGDCSSHAGDYGRWRDDRPATEAGSSVDAVFVCIRQPAQVGAMQGVSITRAFRRRGRRLLLTAHFTCTCIYSLHSHTAWSSNAIAVLSTVVHIPVAQGRSCNNSRAKRADSASRSGQDKKTLTDAFFSSYGKDRK